MGFASATELAKGKVGGRGRRWGPVGGAGSQDCRMWQAIAGLPNAGA